MMFLFTLLTQIQEPKQEVPTWVLVALVSLLFSFLTGVLVWIFNRILNQVDENQRENKENFKVIKDAIVSIEKTTLIQTEILKNHADDLKTHDDILSRLAGTTKLKK
jgi:hypothetical protein